MNIVTLKPKQERFLLALVTEPNIKQAYQKAGITQKTAYKYLADEMFKAEYSRLRRENMARTTALLQSASAGAVKVLYDIASNAETSPYARVQASRTILEFAYKGTELEDIENRIDKLEKHLKEEGNK